MTETSLREFGNSRFRRLLDDVQNGNQEACRTIVDEYGDHLLRAVRRHMNRAIRDRADSEDFAQSVWGAFFGQISVIKTFEKEGQLVGFLSRVAANKVIDAGRRRRVRREKTLCDDMQLTETTKDHRLRISEPTPSEHAVANERWSQLNANVGKLAQQVLGMLREGRSQIEIASTTGISERHVRRIVSKLSKGLPEA